MKKGSPYRKKFVFPVILEYCGGKNTDTLYHQLRQWNPDYPIAVLDNASATNRASCITHQNKVNSNVGGGIRDCIGLARHEGFSHVLIITNDVVPANEISIVFLEEIARYSGDIVQVGVSLAAGSDKLRYYPWMANRGDNKDRYVHHCDILFSVLKIDFIDSFGGFPPSQSGWGYDWEVSYQAALQHKKIVITDKFQITHTNNMDHLAWNTKLDELKKVYDERYSDHRVISPF